MDPILRVEQAAALEALEEEQVQVEKPPTVLIPPVDPTISLLKVGHCKREWDSKNGKPIPVCSFFQNFDFILLSRSCYSIL
jgi:hypothetical protein